MYLIKTPFWLPLIYPSCVWRIKEEQKIIYLTFDDGPHTLATPFVLDELKKYQAKASFFCIGKNVLTHPSIYQAIISDGHKVGNHSFDHVNGWKTKTTTYLENIQKASSCIHSNLFRPPYGRITMTQLKKIRANKNLPQQIIMWDVLSGDFDIHLDGATCARKVIAHADKGSIVVFHDSAKAMDRLTIALPAVLAHFTQLGFQFKALPNL